jgi:endo-1,4-beta-xylanase
MDYFNTVAACVAASGGGKCVGVTLWDYTDKYYWVRQVDSGAGSACPWDKDLCRKDGVYSTIVDALGDW